MTDPYRGALIGCGFFAANHMNAWAGLERARIVAVCDLDAEKAQAMAKRFGVPEVYIDAAAMLAEQEREFVDVATTSASHRALVELAAPRAGLIICQKPFADRMIDAQAMVAAAAGAGATLLVHENFRWQRPFREIKRRIEAGEIGTPQFARISFRHGYDNYVNQPYLAEIERFTLMDVGLHLFDLARWLMGEVSTLSCRTQRLNPIVRGEDAFTTLLGHATGATTVADCSFFTKVSPERFPQTTAWIEGDRGTLELDEGYRLTLHGTDSRQEADLEPPVPQWGERPWHAIQDSVAAFQSHVVDVLDGTAAPQPSGEDNLKTLALALSAYEAAATDRVISLADWQETAS